MKTAATAAQMLVRLTGLILIVLGVLFWTDHAQTLIPLHRLVGFVFVLSLWTLAVLAVRAGVRRDLVVLAVLWGFVAPILGLTQEGLLTGDAHWVIQVVHLLVGLGAIALGELLAVRIKRAAGSQGLRRPAGPAIPGAAS